MAVGEIQYAKRGDLHIGYQVQGDGPVDLLAISNGSLTEIDRDDEPRLQRFDQHLASFTRLIRFDAAGFGLSDPPRDGSSFTLDAWMQDAIAVLDAAGSTQAAVFGVGEGGLVAIELAARFPERVSALVLMHAYARLAVAEDYPCGLPQDLLDSFVEAVADPNYAGDPVDDLGLMAPSLAADTEFRSWWKRAGERVAGPAMAHARNRLAISADVRADLPAIDRPTLVLHRIDNHFMTVGFSRFLEANIAGARLVELPGRDHLAFVGDTDELLGEMEEFLTGARAAPPADRVMATVLFTDIVQSTQRAAGTGDRRWRELLDDHDRMAAREIRRGGGRQVKTTGDGMLVTFDSPSRAVQCGLALCAGARRLGLEVRVGIHAGEIERRGDDIAGIGVHIAARVQSYAAPGEVWVSRTVADLVTGSGIVFVDRGEHELRGVPGPWQLLSVPG